MPRYRSVDWSIGRRSARLGRPSYLRNWSLVGSLVRRLRPRVAVAKSDEDAVVSGFFSRFDRSGRKNSVTTPSESVHTMTGGKADASAAEKAREAIERADEHRDRQEHGPAAQWYAAALETLPDRSDVRVQLANMLKDSGRLAEAQAHYRVALAADPQNADIALQLGRSLKMSGHLSEAAGMLEHALQLAPDLADAATELLHLGRLSGTHPVYERDAHVARMTGLFKVTAELTRLRNEIEKALDKLPDLGTWAAAPAELYGLMRELHDLPAPPDVDEGPTIAILADVDAASPRALHGLIASLRAQTCSSWTLLAVGSDPSRRDAVVTAGIVDDRIRWLDRGDEPGWPVLREAHVLTLRRGGMLHATSIAWLHQAILIGGKSAYVMDEEIGTLAIDGTFQAQHAELRACPDYDSQLEADCTGETLLLTPQACASAARSIAALVDRGRLAQIRLDLIAAGEVGHLPLPLVQSLALDAVPEEARQKDHLADVANHLVARGDARSGARHGFVCAQTKWHASLPASDIGVVIPTRDNGRDVIDFADSLVRLATHPERVHILVVDNGSRDPETLGILASLSARPRISIERIDEPFNWSRLNNRGAAASTAELLLFANDDMSMLSPGWDATLTDLLLRDDVGVVGARLLYPDDTMQHAGVISGWKGAVNNDGLRRHVSEPGPSRRWHVTRSVAAVVGAFIATRRVTFDAVGGFDAEHLPVGFSDVDYCFKVRASGLKILWSPHITLHHHEAKSRGLDYTSPAKQARYDGEQAVMERRWPDALTSDPSVNPFWHDATLPFRLLQMPPADRVCNHLRATSAAQPWRLAPRSRQSI